MKCRRLATWKDEQGVEHKDVVWFGSMGTRKVPSPFRDDLTFANATWTEIDDVIQSGLYKKYFNIGDTKVVTYGAETQTITIIDFDHDDLADGSGKAAISLDLGTYAKSQVAENVDYLSSAWKDSIIRNTVVPQILTTLEAGLSSRIVEVIKAQHHGRYSGAPNPWTGGAIYTTNDTLFTYSASEVFTNVSEKYEGEGTIYEWFKTADLSILKNRWSRSQPQEQLSLGTAGFYFAYNFTSNTAYLNPVESFRNASYFLRLAGAIGKAKAEPKEIGDPARFFNPDDKHDNYSDKQQGVVDSLTQRLSVIRRELWYDVDYGLPLLDKQKSKVAIDAFIGKTVLAHPDVDSIQDFDSKIINKVYTCSMKIITKYGEIILNV